MKLCDKSWSRFFPRTLQRMHPFTPEHEEVVDNITGRRFGTYQVTRETLRRLLRVHDAFLRAIGEGFVPPGNEAQRILYEPDSEEEADLADALRSVSGRHNAADFNRARATSIASRS